MSLNWKKWGVFAACAAIAAIVIGVTLFNDSDEDKIKKVLVDLAKTVMVKTDDTLISRTGRIRGRVKELVDDDVRVNVEELPLDVRGRRDFEDGAAKVGLIYQQADCDFASVTVKIDPSGTLATADAVAVVTASRGGERKADRRDVHFLLRKDGKWKISTIDVSPKKAD